MREVIYDTETTGLNPEKGDRIIEIAAIELIDGKFTGNHFYSLINPERDIPEEVIKVHGITNEKVANSPKFKDVLSDVIDFFKDAKAIAHNAEFDEKFINSELKIANHPDSFWSIVGETEDTLAMSKRIWVGKDPSGKKYKHSLDAILERCQIDASERVLHGALIDSKLLAQAYLQMKQKIIELGPTLEDDVPRPPIKRIQVDFDLPTIKRFNFRRKS